MSSKRLTPEMLVDQKLVSDARISPDGKYVAYCVRPISREGEHKRGNIWLVDFEGEDATQFTSGPGLDSEPRWSPDGSQLAFVSDREKPGDPRLYTMPVGGGEASKMQISDGKADGNASSPRWSPDGRFLAWLVKEPETEDEKKRKEERDDARVADQDLKYTRLFVLDTLSDEAVRVTPERRQVVGFDWLPDNRRLVVALTDTPLEDEYFLASSIEVYSRVGEQEDSVLEVRGPVSDLCCSPDGARIAYLGMSGNDGIDGSVFVVPIGGWQARNLTEGYEGTASSLCWLPDGELYFSAYEGLFGALNRLSLDGEIEPVLPEDYKRKGSLQGPVTWSADGCRYATVRTSGTEALDVWAGETGGDLRRLTRTNPDLEELLLPMVPLSWRGRDGLKIEGMLIYPADYKSGERYPLIVDVHGGPAWLWSDRLHASWHDWGQYLAVNGYVVLLPNPRGSVGRGAAFTRANFDDIGGGEFTDIMAGVDEVIDMGMADPDRLGIAGWSWGGYLSSWTVTQTDRFKAAVVGAGVTNLFSDQGQNDVPHMNDYYFRSNAYGDPIDFMQRSALYHVSKVVTPVLVLHGEADERVTAAQGRELFAALKYQGKTVEMCTYPREGHSFEERRHQLDLINRVLEWFDRYLKA